MSRMITWFRRLIDEPEDFSLDSLQTRPARRVRVHVEHRELGHAKSKRPTLSPRRQAIPA